MRTLPNVTNFQNAYKSYRVSFFFGGGGVVALVASEG